LGYNASEAKSVRGRTRFVVLLRAINVGNRKAQMAALREACRDAVCTLYRPHGSFAAGAIAIAAGVYEFTPLKPVFRRRCCENVRFGFEFGLYCVGSCIGLMLMQVALGVMSVTWMSVIAVLVPAQKLLPARAAIDVALAIVGLGILIVIAPSSVIHHRAGDSGGWGNGIATRATCRMGRREKTYRVADLGNRFLGRRAEPHSEYGKENTVDHESFYEPRSEELAVHCKMRPIQPLLPISP
jgi:hypothetical protein